ncbi:hypothetical protein BSPWISOXPB_3157 [uncultured Gammaproteobacteria bacterium]|nr:hypothetical protein BSPWISOXPB_3157 [uncultured Gammaproteobacteria bacterium]
MRKVSLASCSLGEKYAIKLLPKLREQGISDAKVSVRPAPVMVLLDGRKIIMDSEEGSSGKYRSSALKKTLPSMKKAK